MQPPRRRAPQFDFRGTETLRSIILNFTAILATVLFVRLATLSVENADQATIPDLIQSVTNPVLWPFTTLPVLGDTAFNDATFADIILIPLVILLGLLVGGIITGWRDYPEARNRYTGPYE